MAYKDWAYYLKKAQQVIDNEKISVTKITSGYNKGEYLAKIIFPKSVEDEYGKLPDENPRTKYLVNRWGVNIMYYTQYGGTTKEESIKRLKDKIAHSLSDHDKTNKKHYLSELWEYYQSKKEELETKANIYLPGEIGYKALDYFFLIEGKINESNWKNYTYNSTSGNIGSITNIKELYYHLKKQAIEEFNDFCKKLSNREHYTDRENILKKCSENYIFDIENIPEIVEYEAILEGGTVKNENQPEKEQSEQPKPIAEPLKIEIDRSLDTGHIKIGYRPEFLKTPILYGRERILILANGEKHRAQYAIVELENILASHNEYSFSDTPEYPVNSRGENINDRNYSGDKNAQAKVVDIAQNFEPETQISTSASASGLPVITVDGIVVSGNNRTMSIKRMVKDFPDNYMIYKQILAREIETFGYENYVGISLSLGDKISLPGSSYHNPLSIKLKNPVLVRIDYDFPAYNTTEMNKYNKDTKKAERPIDRAIKLSSMLLDNENCFNMIAEIVGNFETLSDFYANNQEVARLKKYMIECNILTTQEIPAYFTEGQFNQIGKEFLMNLLAGMVLDKKALIASEIDGVKRFKEKIVTALPVLMKNSKLPEGSLKAEINEAIMLQQAMVSKDMDISFFIRSPELFAENEANFSKKAYYINELLNMTKFAFKQSVEAYNDAVIKNQGESLFGDKITPDEIFNTIIKNKIEKETADIIEKFYEKKHGEKKQQPITKEIETETQEIIKARAKIKAKLLILKLKASKKNKE